MSYLNLCSCNFLKISAFQKMPIYPICPWPCELLTGAWPIQGAPPTQLSEQSLPHFLCCYSSRVGRELWQHPQTHFFVFFKSFCFVFWCFFFYFFPSQVLIKIGTGSTGAVLSALPCLCLKAPSMHPPAMCWLSLLGLQALWAVIHS